MVPVSGWRAAILVIAALVVVALLLTALFWLGVLLVTIAACVWFNLALLPRVSARTRIPQLILAAALLPILAAIGYGLAGTAGVIGGSLVWLFGIAVPRAALWRFSRRLDRRRELTTIDAQYSSRTFR
jgi:hypothetical protein